MEQHHVTLIRAEQYIHNLFVCNRFFAHVLFAPVKITHVLIFFVAASVHLESKPFENGTQFWEDKNKLGKRHDMKFDEC